MCSDKHEGRLAYSLIGIPISTLFDVLRGKRLPEVHPAISPVLTVSGGIGVVPDTVTGRAFRSHTRKPTPIRPSASASRLGYRHPCTSPHLHQGVLGQAHVYTATHARAVLAQLLNVNLLEGLLQSGTASWRSFVSGHTSVPCHAQKQSSMPHPVQGRGCQDVLARLISVPFTHRAPERRGGGPIPVPYGAVRCRLAQLAAGLGAAGIAVRGRGAITAIVSSRLA